jgi:hypothetical protein
MDGGGQTIGYENDRMLMDAEDRLPSRDARRWFDG